MSALLDWLDGWGPELRSRVHMAQHKAWAEAAPNMTGKSTVPSPMLVVCVLALTVPVSMPLKQWVFLTTTAGRLKKQLLQERFC